MNNTDTRAPIESIEEKLFITPDFLENLFMSTWNLARIVELKFVNMNLNLTSYLFVPKMKTRASPQQKTQIQSVIKPFIPISLSIFGFGSVQFIQTLHACSLFSLSYSHQSSFGE
jgi:hypothetical protein